MEVKQLDLLSDERFADQNPKERLKRAETICEKNCCIFDIDHKTFKEIELGEVFDTKRFDTLKIVSYVASPSYFNSFIRGFLNIELIIGIDETEVCSSIQRGIINNVNVMGDGFFKDSPDELKDAISEETVKIRFCRLGSVAHSKIYLFSSSETEETAVLIGSSNVTNNAFGIGKKQYEDNLYSEDPLLYQFYLIRFSAIYRDTIDYIPERAKKVWKEERRILTLDETNEAKIHHIDSNREFYEIKSEEMNALKGMRNNRTEPAEEAERTIEIIRTIYEPNKGGKKKIKSLEEIQKEKVKLIVKKHSETVNADLNRTEITYDSDTNSLFMTRPGIEDGALARRFDMEVDTEEINKELELLEKVVSLYKEYAVSNDIRDSKRAYEIILYAMASPFIWKLRKDYQSFYNDTATSGGADIANILMINGVGSTGKTALLAFINKMLQEDAYMIPGWKRIHDKGGWSILEPMIDENNLFPIIIDEVENNFTKSTAETKIKDIANELAGKEHPFIIAATNKELEITSPLRRRISYITMNSKIRNTDAFRREMARAISNADNKLFRCFCYKTLERMQKGGLYDPKCEKAGQRDIIDFAREIFKGIYEAIGRKIPECFPEQAFDDYSYVGKQMWRDVYLDISCKDAFSERNGEIVVNKEHLTQKQYSKKAQQLEAYLNEYVLSEGDAAKGAYIHLNKENFLKWIEVEDKRKGLLHRIKDVFT